MLLGVAPRRLYGDRGFGNRSDGGIPGRHACRHDRNECSAPETRRCCIAVVPRLDSTPDLCSSPPQPHGTVLNVHTFVRQTARREAGGAALMRIVIFGLAVSSSWGNGHAALWRGLIRALHAGGHRVTFFERDVPYYAEHRDLTELPSGTLVLYRDWDPEAGQARRGCRGCRAWLPPIAPTPARPAR